MPIKRPAPRKTEPTRRTNPKAKAATVTDSTVQARAEKGPVAKVLARRKPRPRRETGEGRPAPAVVAQIRELEEELDRLIDAASQKPLSSDDGEHTASLAATTDIPPLEVRPEPEHRLIDAAVLPELSHDDSTLSAPEQPTTSSGDQPERRSDTSLQRKATVFETARELLSTDHYLRKWARRAMRDRSEEVDDFGFDPVYEQKARALLEFLYTRYFRVETTGIDHVPARGRCLLVSNHSGTLPLDGLMLRTAVKLEHGNPREVRWLTEDFIHHMPYLGATLNRLGAVRACQENAGRLLDREELVAVFPEGVKGTGKLYAERYRLQRFGRGGFIKLCLRTKTPIVPVAIVGAEETNPLLFRVERLSSLLGLPFVPVTPTFPWLGPLGLLPAPTKWQIRFGDPIDFSQHDPSSADDDLLVGKLAERVRATIQGMLDRAVGSRKSVFFG